MDGEAGTRGMGRGLGHRARGEHGLEGGVV